MVLGLLELVWRNAAAVAKVGQFGEFVAQPGMTMMKRTQSALPHPDSSSSRKMSVKMEMSSQIQATSSMNQKIDNKMTWRYPRT